MRLGFFVGVFCILAAGVAYAQTEADDYCAPYPNIPVQVKPVFDEPVLDNAQNLATLQTLGRDKEHMIPHNESVLLGMTRYIPVIEFHAPVVRKELSDGSACARVDHVDATIGYRDIRVLIASEFPQGSCDYQQVLTHEQKHVAVNRDVLRDYAEKIQERLTSELKLHGLFRISDMDYAEKTVRENIGTTLHELDHDMMAENESRQRAVDSPEEYARNDVACQGHIAETARRYWLSHH